MSGAVVWKTRDPYHGLGREGLEAALKARLAGRVAQAWMFGSHARGTAGPDSDLDLIVVTETAVPFTRRPALFDDLYELAPALDLLVYTPAEFARLEAQAHSDRASGFWSSVMSQRRRLI